MANIIIIITPLAKIDLQDIWRFIATDNEVAATNMLKRIEATFKLLTDNPLAGRARHELHEDVRSIPVGNYIVFYQALPNAINIVRVLSRYRDIMAMDFD